MTRATLRIVLPGGNRYTSADVLLSDMARKLQGVALPAGEHVVMVLDDGSVMVNGQLVWQPKVMAVQKAG